MKKLLLLIALILISCEKYDIEEECNCEKITYIKYKEYLVISRERIGCVPEKVDIHIVENIYYSISCQY